ncbi:transmembrane protein, putative (macronuclear) [Tetrahymena thermophila SB210]|uniref:Transmembrane protein, putative n=1 Tax=Tetrahymena thermophila (strain SB210) TaxID=312017 RepID=W7WZM0_TETTS|nr:transmembrane protein, putative [Tetrahymena thermophila SB210]EWS71042.1 transmembrane protein, putative [Tetrahymena thermophila SB210]|eukprot:XP_012656423.1 transmembrane protein, putative [Tetrahymena thermophila SB210]
MPNQNKNQVIMRCNMLLCNLKNCSSINWKSFLRDAKIIKKLMISMKEFQILYYKIQFFDSLVCSLFLYCLFGKAKIYFQFYKLFKYLFYPNRTN